MGTKLGMICAVSIAPVETVCSAAYIVVSACCTKQQMFTRVRPLCGLGFCVQQPPPPLSKCFLALHFIFFLFFVFSRLPLYFVLFLREPSPGTSFVTVLLVNCISSRDRHILCKFYPVLFLTFFFPPWWIDNSAGRSVQLSWRNCRQLNVHFPFWQTGSIIFFF